MGGVGPGLLTITLSAVLGWWAFTPPYFTIPVGALAETIQVVLFIVASTTIVAGATAYRRILWRLNEEEHFRQIIVDELAHRVKNKLATVQAILRRELRTHPAIWDTVQGRLNALAMTDEFIRSSASGTASFRAILAMESVPYDAQRFSFYGDDIELNGKLAGTVALIVHELATNSSKHGALSCLAGHVFVTWQLDGHFLRGEWIERGGPLVQSPKGRGFGLSLIECGLRPYQGEVSVQFAPSGLQCSFFFSVATGEITNLGYAPRSDGYPLPALREGSAVKSA